MTFHTKWPKQSLVLSGKSVYGNPVGRGGGSVSPLWENAELVTLHAPWPMQMGTIKIKTFRMHKYCAPSLLEVFRAIKSAAQNDYETLEHWGMTEFSGAFNYRLMRGGTKLSMHSYGCAIDFDAPNNGLSDKTPRFALFPKVLKAFKDQGWTWGGDWNGNDSTADERSPDGMHWQASFI